MAISLKQIRQLKRQKQQKTIVSKEPEAQQEKAIPSQSYEYDPTKIEINPTNITLSEHTIAPHLPTISYFPESISPSLQSTLMDFFYKHDSTPWVELKSGRRVKVYGGLVGAAGLENKQPLPEMLQCLCQKLHKSGAIPKLPNHILLNEYYPGDGILPHTDGPAYFPHVCIISLNSPLVLSFWPQMAGGLQTIESAEARVLLDARSMIVFSDDAYSKKTHGILESTEDPISPDILDNFHLLPDEMQKLDVSQRKLRVSLTIRFVEENK